MSTWVAYHGRTRLYHESQVNLLGKDGYRTISLSVTGSSGHRRYAAVWVKAGGPEQRWFQGKTGAQYQAIFNGWTEDGYRPTILAATGFAPEVFAGVFEKSSIRFRARHGMSRQEFTDRNWSAQQDGFILRWAAVYGEVTESGGVFEVPTFKDNTLYAGVWEANPAEVKWEVTLVQTGSRFQDDFTMFTKDGYRLAFVTVTGRQPLPNSIESGHHYLGVFRKDSIGPWVAHHDMTSDDYQNRVKEHKKEGFLPIVVQAHGQVTNIRYAAIFAQSVP
jgi:hypothetical protein